MLVSFWAIYKANNGHLEQINHLPNHPHRSSNACLPSGPSSSTGSNPHPHPHHAVSFSSLMALRYVHWYRWVCRSLMSLILQSSNLLSLQTVRSPIFNILPIVSSSGLVYVITSIQHTLMNRPTWMQSTPWPMTWLQN